MHTITDKTGEEGRAKVSTGMPRTPLERELIAKGMTYYALHKAVMDIGHKVTLGEVGKHTRGQVALSLRHAVAYARVLGVPVESLDGKV